MEQPITAVIGGLGVRGYEVYASYARRNPDKIRIVAVADPDPAKRTAAREAFGLAEESCYESMEALLEAPRLGDVAVIATGPPACPACCPGDGKRVSPSA